MLASMLMESAFGAPDVSPEVLSRYNHEDGAALIAMESAADLHDIFVEGFIGMEELEFQQYRANMEGASEDVMEGIGDKIVSSAKNAIAKVKAFIKLVPGVEANDATKQTILAYCRKHVAKYAMPYDIEFKDEMPKTLVGKVAYRVLEEEEQKKLAAAAGSVHE